MSYEEDTYSIMFSALKHPMRRRILVMLNQGPLTYTAILKNLGVESGVLTYHIDKLGLLISKDNDKYVLSEFGRAASSLTLGVENPHKVSKYRIGFKKGMLLITLIVISISTLPIGYSIYNYNLLRSDYTNSFKDTIINSRGLIVESINILNSSIDRGLISSNEYQVLYKNLIMLTSHCSYLKSLDTEHQVYWLQISDAFDSTANFMKLLNDKVTIYRFRGFNNMTTIDISQKTSLSSLRDDLITIGKAFQENVVKGNDPRIYTNGAVISNAADASMKLQSDILSARIIFGIAEYM